MCLSFLLKSWCLMKSWHHRTQTESKPQKPDSDCSAWWMTENYNNHLFFFKNKAVWFLCLCQINFWVSVSLLHETVVVTWWNERVFRGKRATVAFDHSRLSCSVFNVSYLWILTVLLVWRESIWWLWAEHCKRVSHQCHCFLLRLPHIETTFVI